MTKFFVRWHVDNSKLELPTTPAEIGKLFSAMLKMAKVDLHFGSFSTSDNLATEWKGTL